MMVYAFYDFYGYWFINGGRGMSTEGNIPVKWF
jgi:hypothetical protein